jgi:hypothetical protein
MWVCRSGACMIAAVVSTVAAAATVNPSLLLLTYHSHRFASKVLQHHLCTHQLTSVHALARHPAVVAPPHCTALRVTAPQHTAVAATTAAVTAVHTHVHSTDCLHVPYAAAVVVAALAMFTALQLQQRTAG